MGSIYRYSILFLLSTSLSLFVSCSSEDDDVKPDNDEEEVIKSDAKVIASFSFAALSDPATGVIDGNTIIFSVPFETDATALIPTIEISEKATVSPESGVAQDFTNDVEYTVTAEDESTTTYTVTVEKEIIPITVDPIIGFPISGDAPVQRRSYILLTGTNFIVGTSSIVLENEGVELEMIIAVEQVDRIGFLIDNVVPIGENTLIVRSGGSEVIYGQKLIVGYASPEISGISSTSIIVGGEITIEGDYFATDQASLEVSLTSNGTDFALAIVSSTATSITATVPSDLELGTYTLKVASYGYAAFYNDESVEIIADPDQPVLTSVNDTSFSRGETIIFQGQNLGKAGETTKILFEVFISGSNQEDVAQVNEAGTELSYTIPDTFDTGTYLITVQVGDFVSDDVGEVIQITP